VDGSIREPARRTLSPAVLASAAFVAVCALIAITFVAARGGLQMPVAPGGSQAAVASPFASPIASEPPPTSPPPATVAPTLPASQPPPATVAPSAAGSSSPPVEPTPAASPDALTALPACPGIEGCFEYEIQRGDSLSGVASRYVIPVATVLALNPEIDDPSTIVVGQVLYLGRDPLVRLQPCTDQISCWLYVVQPGDGLSTIAARFDVTVEAIISANPGIDDPNEIFTGQTIRLLRPEG
jgi:nucleoid-associated protein YgaU